MDGSALYGLVRVRAVLKPAVLNLVASWSSP